MDRFDEGPGILVQFIDGTPPDFGVRVVDEENFVEVDVRKINYLVNTVSDGLEAPLELSSFRDVTMTGDSYLLAGVIFTSIEIRSPSRVRPAQSSISGSPVSATR